MPEKFLKVKTSKEKNSQIQNFLVNSNLAESDNNMEYNNNNFFKKQLKNWVEAGIYDSSIRYRVIEFFEEMEFWCSKKKKTYWDTNANELKLIFNCETKGTVSKRLKYLENKGYIIIDKAWCMDGMHRHYRLFIATKFLIDENPKPLETRVFNKGTKFPDRKNPNNIIRLKSNNIKKSNKSSSDEFSKNKKNGKQVKNSQFKKPKNTTNQDMLKIFNEILHSNIAFEKWMGRYFYAAFKQKFKTLEKWKEYVTAKTRGLIKSPLGYLRYLLKFVNINKWLEKFELKNLNLNKKNNLDYVSLEYRREMWRRQDEMQDIYTKWLSIFDFQCKNRFKAQKMAQAKMREYDINPALACQECEKAFQKKERQMLELIENRANQIEQENKQENKQDFNSILKTALSALRLMEL